MSQANIDNFNAEINIIEEKIKSLEAEYAGKRTNVDSEAKTKLETLQSTKGKEIEVLLADLNQKQKTFDKADAAKDKAKEELNLSKTTYKTENSMYEKDIKILDKEKSSKVKDVDSELKKLIKEQNSEIKGLEKQIKQENKEIQKAMEM